MPENSDTPRGRKLFRLGSTQLRSKRPGGAKPRASVEAGVTGIGARDLALDLLVDVLDRRRPFDDSIATAFTSAKGLALDARDRGLARLLAATVLRHKGVIEGVLASFMQKPLAPRHEDVRRIMLVGAAQILYLDTPPHAAVSIAVTQCRRHGPSQHLSKLVNAVLRRTSLEGRALLAQFDDFDATLPQWLRDSLLKTYGAARARDIAGALLTEAPLDLTVRDHFEAGAWAERLGGVVLATGSVRLQPGGRIEDRDGYAQGAWWVQDTAAALPARLLGDKLDGLQVADLCAAPGGKTAQLAASGASVTAVEVSAARLKRLEQNLARLALKADIVEADVGAWQPGRQFDAVLLDAPCSASGTIRRHPDILHSKDAASIEELVRIQTRLLDNASRLVRPGGRLVYCTCSLGQSEGENRIQGFLAKHPEFVRVPIEPGETGIEADWLTPEGALRTLPTSTPAGDHEGRGMDGFFAARLQRKP